MPNGGRAFLARKRRQNIILVKAPLNLPRARPPFWPQACQIPFCATQQSPVSYTHLHEQELAAKRSADALREAKEKSADLVAQAEKRAQQIVEEAKGTANVEKDKIVASAQAEIEQEVERAKQQLRERVAELAVAGAEKILRKEINASVHADMLGSLKQDL